MEKVTTEKGISGTKLLYRPLGNTSQLNFLRLIISWYGNKYNLKKLTRFITFKTG